MRRAILPLLFLLSACVAEHTAAAPRAETPFQTFVSIYGDTLKLSDDSTYLVKSPGSNVWLGGRWSRAVYAIDQVGAGEYCGRLAVASDTAAKRCGGFWDLKIAKRLQDPRSIFFNEQVSRFWDLK